VGDLPGHEFHGNQWTGGTEADAERHWRRELAEKARSPEGLLVAHETPGDQAAAVRARGLTEPFATVGKASDFVTSDVKTRVWIRVPPEHAGDVSPDTRYFNQDPPAPHLEALNEHGGTRGADVSLNYDVPPSHVERIEVVDRGRTRVAYQRPTRGARVNPAYARYADPSWWRANPPRKLS